MTDNKQNQTPYIEGIIRYLKKNRIPLHVPGHKQGKGISPLLLNLWGEEVFRYDLTEVEGLDYLHNPTGILREAQDLATELYGVDSTFFLINGSTVGNLVAIMSMAKSGEYVLLPRNSHRSVYGALAISGILPLFLSPAYDKGWGLTTFISPKQLQVSIESTHDKVIKGLVLTSPDCFGLTAHTEELLKIAHKYNLTVLVDEAHGAHFPFHPCLPPSAINFKADFVVQSTHKTLGSLTQSSLLHLRGERVNRDLIKNYLSILQSSSPSCLHLMSLDAARRQIAAEGKELLSKAIANAEWLRFELNKIPGLEVLSREKAKQLPNVADMDPTKLLVRVSSLGITGFEAKKILGQKFGIEVELADYQSVLLVITIGDDIKALRQVKEAFLKLSKDYKKNMKSTIPIPEPPPIPPQVVSPLEALNLPSLLCEINSALNRVSAAMIIPYPPGVPIISYGEKVTKEVISYLTYLEKLGAEIIGLHQDGDKLKIKILS